MSHSQPADHGLALSHRTTLPISVNLRDHVSAVCLMPMPHAHVRLRVGTILRYLFCSAARVLLLPLALAWRQSYLPLSTDCTSTTGTIAAVPQHGDLTSLHTAYFLPAIRYPRCRIAAGAIQT